LIGIGIKALGEGHSPIWEPTDEVEINKIENEYKRSMMLDYIIPKETDIWSSININMNKPNGETVTLPVKRVRTPIKARHGVNSMVAIEARSRREITQETVDDEKIMTINNSYIPTGAYRENEREEYVGERVLVEKPLEKIMKTVGKKANLHIPKLASLKRGMKELSENDIEDSLGMVLSKQATERRETEEDAELHNMYMLLSERQKKKGKRSLSPKQIDEIIEAQSGQNSARSKGGRRDVEKGEDLLDDVVIDLKSDAVYVYEKK